ncbi:hypothetical protein [Kribbella sp. NPDC051620]|uniref:hypothetical protein n=1 Tax=Kribbella sp. NPDC051620 TaxID=3364120 RepID=UPI003792188F
MTRRSLDELVWVQLHFQRPVSPVRILELLQLWTGDPRNPRLVLEARSGRTLQLLLGVPRRAESSVKASVQSVITGTRFTADDVHRPAVSHSASIRLSSRTRALRTDDPEPSTRAILAALGRVFDTEELVLQIVLGPRKAAKAVAARPSAHGSGLLGPLPADRTDSDARSALRAKQKLPGFDCIIRIGVTAQSPRRRRTLVAGFLTGLRTAETPGVRFRLIREASRRLNHATSPWWWPTALNSGELVGLLGWPIGDADYPGVPGIHPRLLPPSNLLSAAPDRVVAIPTAPGHTSPVGLDVDGSLRHTWVLGPNGTGKSTLLANLVVQDIAAGSGVVVIEPKGDLVRDILERMPANRIDDLVILDPTDDAPVGLNPLSGRGREETRVEGLLSVFRSLYADSWGPRTQDIVHSSLLTLARRGDASVAMVPLLLTNTGFRRSVVRRVAAADPVALGPFWAWYEALSDGERATVIAPIMNKMRPFLLNPGLRAVIGQRKPRITMSQILTDGKILLIPLRKQIIGAEAARLTGSLAVAELWQAIQNRLSVPAASRRPVMVYIDEVQDYLHLPTDLADALAQARGLGAGFTLAHQYASQLSNTMRAGFVGNIRSRIAFQLAYDDATLLAKGHPEITADDFATLPAFHVYASLATSNGQVTPYASGRTVALSPPSRDPDALRRISQERYGQSLDTVEKDLAELVEVGATSDNAATGGSGRKRRSS